MSTNENQKKSSVALDLENLNAKYKNLLVKYKQAVLDYIDNLNVESVRPCAKYSADSINISQACYDDIWKKAGCTTTGKVSASNKSAQTLNGLILDAWKWATIKDDNSRNTCYGTTEGSPYYILGVSATNGKLLMLKSLDSNWSEVKENTRNDLAAICTGMDGKMIIAATKSNNVFYKATYNAPKWIDTQNKCCVISVAMGKDGTLVGVGTDNQLYTKPNLNGAWFKASNPDEWISSICIAPDDSIFCIGKNNSVFKKNSYKNLPSQTWRYMGNTTCCVKAITIAPDGTFIGVGKDNNLYTKNSYKDLTTNWKGPYTNTCCVIGITTIPNPSYSGVVFNTSKNPNYKINAPILTSIKGQAFWGTSAVGESVSKSLQECSALCSNTNGCSGATFNPDKQYCWLRGGEGTAMPGLTNDYAIVPKSKQLLKIVESLNNDINSVNRKMQSKIDEVYGIYNKQLESRFDKNYSIVDQYGILNKERDKINDMIKEYQTLETTENEMGLYITKNYFLFFIFFAIVFIAIIILAMSSLDENTSNTVAFAIVDPTVKTAKIIVDNVNPFYVMFGIILLVIIPYLYNEYFTYIYNNFPSFKKLSQLGVVYIVFVFVIIFVAITYFSKNGWVF